MFLKKEANVDLLNPFAICSYLVSKGWRLPYSVYINHGESPSKRPVDENSLLMVVVDKRCVDHKVYYDRRIEIPFTKKFSDYEDQMQKLIKYTAEELGISEYEVYREMVEYGGKSLT